jgi:hypothetical protein
MYLFLDLKMLFNIDHSIISLKCVGRYASLELEKAEAHKKVILASSRIQQLESAATKLAQGLRSQVTIHVVCPYSTICSLKFVGSLPLPLFQGERYEAEKLRLSEEHEAETTQLHQVCALCTLFLPTLFLFVRVGPGCVGSRLHKS